MIISLHTYFFMLVPALADSMLKALNLSTFMYQAGTVESLLNLKYWSISLVVVPLVLLALVVVVLVRPTVRHFLSSAFPIHVYYTCEIGRHKIGAYNIAMRNVSIPGCTYVYAILKPYLFNDKIRSDCSFDRY